MLSMVLQHSTVPGGLVSMLVALLIITIAFVLVSRFIEDTTIRLIAQIVLGVLLIIAVINYLGLV